MKYDQAFTSLQSAGESGVERERQRKRERERKRGERCQKKKSNVEKTGEIEKKYF